MTARTCIKTWCSTPELLFSAILDWNFICYYYYYYYYYYYSGLAWFTRYQSRSDRVARPLDLGNTPSANDLTLNAYT